MKDSYASKTEAIEHGILPALGAHAGDYDVEEIANGLERGEFVELTPEALLSTFCERDLMLTRYEICYHYPGVMQEMDRLGLSNYVEAPFEEEGPDRADEGVRAGLGGTGYLAKNGRG